MNFTTLIPAYKTKYIADLLNSLRLQTLRPQQIIISDDSPHGEFREVFFSEPYRPLRDGLNIEFVEGPRTGPYENVKSLVRAGIGRSELVHVLLDDDVLYPEFYERHHVAHASGGFSCAVSRRWSANEAGLPTSGQPVPAAVANSPNRLISLTDELLFLTAVVPCNNWFGEFSNATFRDDCIGLLLNPQLADVSYAGLWDLGAFVAASMRRPLCHLQDHLGFFRIGPGQNSSNLNGPMMKGAHLGYVALALGGRRAGRLADATARQCYAAVLPALDARYSNEPDMKPFRDVLPAMIAGGAGAEERFIEIWNAFLASHGF